MKRYKGWCTNTNLLYPTPSATPIASGWIQAESYVLLCLSSHQSFPWTLGQSPPSSPAPRLQQRRRGSTCRPPPRGWALSSNLSQILGSCWDSRSTWSSTSQPQHCKPICEQPNTSTNAHSKAWFELVVDILYGFEVMYDFPLSFELWNRCQSQSKVLVLFSVKEDQITPVCETLLNTFCKNK